MTTLQQPARQQLEQFLSILFLPDELIELRFIESWFSGGRKKSRVARSSEWLRRKEFLSQLGDINDFARAERANIYFGVCPRRRKGDSHDETIKTVRCLWCDIDDVTTEQAHARWADARVPTPSVVVNSGSGIHAYWLLEDDLTTPETRSQLAAMLPYFYRSFGGDHVQNLSRILRPPGTFNYKDARNGRAPMPCTLVACDPETSYPLKAFRRWIELAKSEKQAISPGQSLGTPSTSSLDEILEVRSEVLELVGRLDRPTPDRSRRDFAIVCDLLRLGLAKEAIWDVVSGRSKFESNGRSYFNVTVSNAERRVILDGTAPSNSGVPG
jgi:hypothetical protein